mgnify:CR=1 FL=1
MQRPVAEVIDAVIAGGVPSTQLMTLLVRAGWDPAQREDAASYRFELHERATVGIQSAAGFHEGRPLPSGW